MLYLELGVIPIRFIIQSRRLNFFKYLLSQPSNTIVSQVLEAQLNHPSRNDWGQTILKDLKDIGLDKTSVKEMSKTQFRKFVQNKVEAYAFIYLSYKKLGHKKSKKIKA